MSVSGDAMHDMLRKLASTMKNALNEFLDTLPRDSTSGDTMSVKIVKTALSRAPVPLPLRTSSLVDDAARMLRTVEHSVILSEDLGKAKAMLRNAKHTLGRQALGFNDIFRKTMPEERLAVLRRRLEDSYKSHPRWHYSGIATYARHLRAARVAENTEDAITEPDLREWLDNIPDDLAVAYPPHDPLYSGAERLEMPHDAIAESEALRHAAAAAAHRAAAAAAAASSDPMRADATV
eukprot:PLAT12596.1.p1 GENE.PLAT12596.1~~PLAT12596.1.p1  ORF type:complete len:236 (+),score=84.60 PLAT12596.1:64-771(+)